MLSIFFEEDLRNLFNIFNKYNITFLKILELI